MRRISIWVRSRPRETLDFHLRDSADIVGVDSIDQAFQDIDGDIRKALADPGADDRSRAGDFNRNGRLDSQDIDLLSQAIQTGGDAERFDLDDNQILDDSDRSVLIVDLLGTGFGDSNLDGVFGTSDLIAIFQLGEFEDDEPGNSTWASGDWDGDGDFGTSDLILAFASGSWQG